MIKWAIAIALILYVASYSVLSTRGKYVPLICGTSNGSEHWYALGCENRKPSFSGRIKTKYPSLLGFFYLPLLLLDQKFLHPSKPGVWNKMDAENALEGDLQNSAPEDRY